MKTLEIARISVLRLIRDRSNIFFVFIFPLALVLVIGLQFGGGFESTVGVVGPDDGLAADFAADVDGRDGIRVERYADADAVSDAVSRGTIQAGVVLPDDYDQRLSSGQAVEVGYVARPDGQGQTLRAVVDEVLGRQGADAGIAALVSAEAAIEPRQALVAAQAARAALPGVSVETARVGESQFEEFEGLGQFDLGASSQLLLFMFLTSLAGSAALIQTRQWGVTRRMLATPTSVGSILAGQALGRFAVALVQGVYIMVGTLLLFGVDWGDPLSAIVILVLFAAVGAGASMLMGAVFSNDAQAGGMGVFLGLALAALGGCMAPLEVFSDTMRQVAHVTPHAWALDAFAETVRRDGTILDILPELAVLTAFAAVLLLLASWQLRRVTVRA